MYDLKIPGGYILLSRKLIESEIMKKPPLYLKVWVWLLLRAQHSDYKRLKRGQAKTSVQEIQEAMSYKVGYRTEKPTYKEIYGIIEWLRNPREGDSEGKSDGIYEGNMMVTTKVTHGFVYTIVKYDAYQNPNNYEGNNEGSAKVKAEVTMKEQRRSRQGNNINNNDKNVKNDKEVIYTEIELFILDHWNSKDITQSEKTLNLQKQIKATLKKFTKDQITQAIDNYATMFKDQSYFYSHMWYLDKFLKQVNGVPDFLSNGQKWINYLNEKKKGSKSGQAAQNKGNFEQRQYDEDYLNSLYENS